MTDQRYYLRLRGKISGPFSLTQLQALRARGQLGRFHEVSEDRQSWMPASSLSGLFAPEPSAHTAAGVLLDVPPSLPPGGVQEVPATPPGVAQTPPGVRTPGRGVAAPAPTWFYATPEGEQRGPLPWPQLETLWQNGQIDDDTLVWQEGMPEWAPFADVADQAAAEGQGADVLGAAPSSRSERLGWQRFVTGEFLLLIEAFVAAGAAVLFGLAMLVAMSSRGAGAGGAPILIILFALVYLGAQSVGATGAGFAAAIPPSSGARGLAIAAFVLSIVKPALFLVVQVVGWGTSPLVFLLNPSAGALLLILFMAFGAVCLARPILVLLLLGTVVRGLRARKLIWPAQGLLIYYIALASIIALTSIGFFAVASGGDRDGAGGTVLTVIFILIFLAYLGWLAWYTIFLLQVRGLLQGLVGRR